MTLLLPKQQIIRDRKYLDFLRTERCLFTGETECEPAHIGTLGKSIKSSDNHAIPLSWRLHRLGHQHGEISMIREHMPDWLLRECIKLYAEQLYRDWRPA